MKKLIKKALALFKKPKEEVVVDPLEAAWPFPMPAEKKKPKVAKATTRPKKPAVVAKTAASTVAKKPAKKTTKKVK